MRQTDISESEVLPFVSEEDQFVRDFLDEAYLVIVGERSYGGAPTNTSIIDPSINMSVESVCQNIRTYLARLHIVALSYPHISSTTRDAIEIVRGFCDDILRDPNIFGHCGGNKMLEVLSAQRWMMYIDSIKNISPDSENIDAYNQGLNTWEDKILSFVSIERLQKEIRISENGSAVFEGDYCFIQDWFQRKFGINFAQARGIIFSSDNLQYSDEIKHIEGLPKTLDDFFQHIIQDVENYIREFCISSDGRRFNLREIETKIESIIGKYGVSAYGSCYDLPETSLILKNQLGFADVLVMQNYFPRSPSF